MCWLSSERGRGKFVHTFVVKPGEKPGLSYKLGSGIGDEASKASRERGTFHGGKGACGASVDQKRRHVIWLPEFVIDNSENVCVQLFTKCKQMALLAAFHASNHEVVKKRRRDRLPRQSESNPRDHVSVFFLLRRRTLHPCRCTNKPRG